MEIKQFHIMSDEIFNSILSTFFLGLSVVILLYWYSTRNHDYFEKRGIPFAKPYPFVGSIVEFFKKPAHEIEQIRYQKLGKLYGHFEGNNLLLSVGDPVLVRDILIKDFQFFTTRRKFTLGNKVMDSSLSVMEGEDWRRVRALITPTFTTGKIKRMTSIFKDSCRTLIQNFKTEKETDIDLKKSFSTYVMDVIASSAFSTKIDSHNDPGNPFVVNANRLFCTSFSWRMPLFFLAPKLTKLLNISVLEPSTLEFFIQATLSIIEERRKTGQKRNDFLQLLLDIAENADKEQNWNIPETEKNADILNNYGSEPDTNKQVFRNAFKNNKTLTMDELIGQCVTFFVAGYDAAVNALACCCYYLALNQDIQEQLREEVDSTAKKFNGELTYEAVQEMKFMDNVVSETLRLASPAVRLERTADADYELASTGIIIPKGMIITIPVYAMQHDADLYPEPDKFDPNRFTAEEKAKRDQYVYLPFGGGPRNCVAMRFALMEIKFGLAYVIASFVIKRSPLTKVPLEYFIGKGIMFLPKEIILKMEMRDDCPLAE